MTLRLSRRTLFASLGAVIAVLGTGYAVIRGRKPGSKRAPRTEAELREHFHYLRFAPDVATRYIADYGRARGKFGDGSTNFYSRFLLSTDFFQHSAATNRELSYVRFYHPASAPCGHPFARFD